MFGKWREALHLAPPANSKPHLLSHLVIWLAGPGHGRPGTADDPDPGRWSRAIAASMLNGQPAIMAGIHEGGMIDIWNRSPSIPAKKSSLKLAMGSH
jgi:hypothetical protein